ncbi:nitrilase family protein [Mangrovimonas sp. ST2L15]|uniref:nitrilase family protein n=1 Tax=Mangrovimonas sp. ST2L15 TaxID=1645916 RepID=UPI0006B688F6|nr:nitrilase family protein [Mangrovimonas sp. ST2L15]
MSNDYLQVCLIQSHLFWENPTANREQFSKKIAAVSEQVDLVVLPEMFSTGFSMQAKKLAESIAGETVNWLVNQAKTHQIGLTGSLIIQEDSQFFNRLFFVFPDGTFQTYDKRHTFTLAGEDRVYKAGSEKLLVDYKGWKICPLICYDLRFPVFARNTEDYDLLLYVANWPKLRIDAWDTLLKARAIENMSYCIGVNRIGLDGNGYEYSGHSAAYDVLGNKISIQNKETEWMDIVSLRKEHIITNRNKLGFLRDRDRFSLL